MVVPVEFAAQGRREIDTSCNLGPGQRPVAVAELFPLTLPGRMRPTQPWLGHRRQRQLWPLDPVKRIAGVHWNPHFFIAALDTIWEQRFLALIIERAALDLRVGRAADRRSFAPLALRSMSVRPDFLSRQLRGVGEVHQTETH